VKLLQQYKYQRFYDVLKQLGMTTLTKPADNYGLSLILGGSEVTMWELAGIYAGMARTVLHQKENKGFALKKDFHPPVFAESKNALGGEERINALDATSIYFAFESMREVMRPGEEGLWQQFTSSQKIAWKTGTSFGFRDAWAIGITPKYVVAVWAGNTNGEGRPGLIGVQVAAPVMFDIFRGLPSSKWFAPPQNNFSFLPVCRQSGFRANMDCPDVDTIMVSTNANKSPLCPYHQIIHLDQSGTFRVNDNCESPANMVQKSWFVLPPTMEWYYKQRNHDYKVLPDFKAGCGDMGNARQMEMIYPQPNSKIYVPLEITGERGKTIFTASHRKPGMKIFWHLDGNFVGTTVNFHQMALSPAPGNHTLTIVDEGGNSITTGFTILEAGRK
jgi:penicillin-binding protein 1C